MTTRVTQLDTHAALGAGERAEIVGQWLEGHNARDIERMLVRASAEIEFRPLRLAGARDVYLGHEGVRLWFAELGRIKVHHELRAQELRADGDDLLVATGCVDLAESPNVAEFCGVYRIADGLIMGAHHRISNRQTMEELSLLRPSAS